MRIFTIEKNWLARPGAVVKAEPTCQSMIDIFIKVGEPPRESRLRVELLPQEKELLDRCGGVIIQNAEPRCLNGKWYLVSTGEYEVMNDPYWPAILVIQDQPRCAGEVVYQTGDLTDRKGEYLPFPGQLLAQGEVGEGNTSSQVVAIITPCIFRTVRRFPSGQEDEAWWVYGETGGLYGPMSRKEKDQLVNGRGSPLPTPRGLG